MRATVVLARCAVGAWLGLVLLGTPTGAADPQFGPPSVVTDFGDIATDRRAFGIAAGDFDEDGFLDIVASFVNGNVAFVRGNGDGTFQPRILYPWKQTFFNGWAFAAADVDGDGHRDVVWGSTVASGPVADGDVRAFLGNGDGTFVVDEYLVSGVSHNAGLLLANVGVDVGSLAAADLDGYGGDDIVVGSTAGDDTVVTVLYNMGGAVFAVEDLFRRPKAVTDQPPIWYAPPGPFGTTRDTIWGLSLGDADGDGDVDLWLGDRNLYVYRYLNDGLGTLTLVAPAVPPIPTRPQVYLQHTGFNTFGRSPSLGSGDLNHDGIADLVLGLQQGTQLPGDNVAHDGELILDLSLPGGHASFAGNPLADVGVKARGVAVADVDGNGFQDIFAGNYAGQVLLLQQIPPDSDGDGLTDDVDNCIEVPNPGQEDVDDDGVGDACDNCVFIANPGQGVDDCVCPEPPDPSSQGFWHHECLMLPEDVGGIDPGNNGNGPQGLHPHGVDFAGELVPCSDTVLSNLLPFLAPERATCDGLDADPANDQCQKAHKQLTALLLNVCAGWVTEGCAIDLSIVGCESSTVGELFFEMADLIEEGDCKQAKQCAAALNDGQGFVGNQTGISATRVLESYAIDLPESQSRAISERR